MAAVDVAQLSRNSPLLALTAIFLLWKALLFLLVVTSPGIGYDTSTYLLDWAEGTQVVPKFVRWDAIYFTQMARHGHVYEQEWAFGIGISSVLSRAARLLFDDARPTTRQIAIAGLALSHLSSWLSMILVWHISNWVRPPSSHERFSACFVAALLYIVSPAGVFLSAPYTESPFAVLNMLAFLLFLKGRYEFSRGRSGAAGTLLVASGIATALATIMRSNGILTGVLFAVSALEALSRLWRQGLNLLELQKLLSFGLAGAVASIGIIWPQYLAYTEYCSVSHVLDSRPWCQRLVPSIFTFVQSHYWNVGLFKYWTVSNIPLFLLAAPTLGVLIMSGMDGMVRSTYFKEPPEAYYLALPQLLLAILAFSSYHVQIISRIASGYPYWYIWMAMQKGSSVKTAVRWMVLYALIQGGLYASFLPPA